MSAEQLPTDAPQTVRSVGRAVDLLHAIADHPGAGVSELARICELNKSTASRLLAALGDLVTRDTFGRSDRSR